MDDDLDYTSPGPRDVRIERAAIHPAEPSFETIDRVARAICMVENDDPCGSVYSMIDESERNGYRHMAKAAILAMRDNGQIVSEK